ncbi:MAG: FtsX-like permease family protein [Candidatus Ranarchaeia archaeon]
MSSILKYAFKRILRSSKLFLALITGVLIATTFFSSVTLSADVTSRKALLETLENYPSDISVNFRYYPTSENVTELSNIISNSNIDGIIGSDLYISKRYFKIDSYNLTTYENNWVAVSNVSRVWENVELVAGKLPTQNNETVIWQKSKDISLFPLGSNFQINNTYWTDTGPEWFLANFTIVGIVELSSKGLQIAFDDSIFASIGGIDISILYRNRNLFISDWDTTGAAILDISSEKEAFGFDNQMLLYIDRAILINPFDIQNSVQALDDLVAQVANLGYQYNVYVYSGISNALLMFQFQSLALLTAMMATAIPVFFVSWYMGTTVSDVSYNLRRREIGLLSTKGYDSKQIMSLFLFEAVLIGVIAGGIGGIIGALITPLVIHVPVELLSSVLNPNYITYSLIFGGVISLFSIYSPAKRASKLNTIDALKSYILVEETTPFKRTFPTICLILGTYKIVLWSLGLSISEIMFMFPGNMYLFILFGFLTVLDGILETTAPLLFFYGFAKLFVLGSQSVQEYISKIGSKIAGEFGNLASRSTRRNPARTAASVFLLGLIVWYGTSVISQSSINENQLYREYYTQVGADLGVRLTGLENLTLRMNEIRALSGILSVTEEYHLSLNSGIGYVSLRSINTSTWLDTAYYEENWFTGDTLQNMFQQLEIDNETIILDINLASRLELGINDTVSIILDPSETRNLRIVGFFGPILKESSWGQLPSLWSYVPSTNWDPQNLTISSTNSLLVNIDPNSNTTIIKEQIQDLGDDISYILDTVDLFNLRSQNAIVAGVQNVTQVGVYFAMLAAAIGTFLLTDINMRERKQEIALMSVKGLSFKQLLQILLIEASGMVLFSIFIGSVVGFIHTYSFISSQNSLVYNSPVLYNLIISPAAWVQILIIFVAIIIGVLIPTLLHSKTASENFDALRG